ncbi:hypothetical protein K7W42_19330 [Deinococcus sp. HMF7604]|uniref:hypothetical protein n=1 Tax=Deinococcus betulae TaxID=2873312 RepID=UPI001CCE9869|nr:hypothetical protein [Deinococcus betulae]MBZ9752994.1 hypothetical protein [Deinococcus betulae]
MTQHRAAFTLALTLAAGASASLPDGHLEKINALQARRGKPDLTAEQVLARPVRLFGNKLTSYYTRMPDGGLAILANQINDAGGPVLSAHVTDNTPLGSFYLAAVTTGDYVASPPLGEPQQELWLDTWFYVLNDAEGQRLIALIDGGVINEASIGYWYDQALCSITGASYWNSPYYAGQTYTIQDPETGASTTRLCFIWTTGAVQFSEGSLVYRGAYPGTKVGGDAASPNLLAASASAIGGPAPQTRFQLAASKDMQAVYEKAPAAGEGAPPQPPQADTKGEMDLKLRLKLPDGSVKEIDATPTEAQALLDTQIEGAVTRGGQAQLEAHATALGLEPKEVTAARLQALAAEAGDGRTYRQDLLNDLHALTLSVSGNDEAGRAAADRTKKAFGTLELADIRAEVQRLTAQRDAGLPNVRLSEDQDITPAKKVTPNFDAV